VYRHYAAPLHRYLARTFQVRSGEATSSIRLGVLDLEDAHQEAFMRAFAERQRLSYDGLRPFLGYLCVIGRSAAVDVLRRRGKLMQQAVPVDDTGTLELPDLASGPEEQAMAAQLREVVRAFLATVPGELRQLAEARFVEGLAQEQVALQLGWTRSEVRTREKRLREAFMAYLEKAGLPGKLAVAAVLLCAAVLGAPARAGARPDASAQEGGHGLV
jgi:RNA polymerase sigma-70 factor (ECF subfamily)